MASNRYKKEQVDSAKEMSLAEQYCNLRNTRNIYSITVFRSERGYHYVRYFAYCEAQKRVLEITHDVIRVLNEPEREYENSFTVRLQSHEVHQIIRLLEHRLELEENTLRLERF